VGGFHSAGNLAQYAGSVARKAKLEKGTRGEGGGVFEGVNGVVILGRNRTSHLGNLSVCQTLECRRFDLDFLRRPGWRTGSE
jgi:hypothetical protein